MWIISQIFYIILLQQGLVDLQQYFESFGKSLISWHCDITDKNGKISLCTFHIVCFHILSLLYGSTKYIKLSSNIPAKLTFFWVNQTFSFIKFSFLFLLNKLTKLKNGNSNTHKTYIFKSIIIIMPCRLQLYRTIMFQKIIIIEKPHVLYVQKKTKVN